MVRLPALLLLFAAAAQAVPVTLARGGQPAATIVAPPKPPERVAQAARDLQHYVRQLCGVTLPLRDDGAKVDGTGLYLDRCQPTRDEDLPRADLNPESFAVRVREGSIYLVGRYPTPSAFAAHALLAQLGIRWFAPGELWEYVPTGTPGELTVDVREVVSSPTTSPRVWSGHEWTDTWKQWTLRNRAVLSEVVPRRQFQNFLHRVFPPEKYGQSHPEYYPLIGGKRFIPPPGETYWRPCESNPEVLRLTVEYAREWFRTHPTVDSFSLGMDDVSHMCSCPNCRALDPHPNSYEQGQFSDRHYKFVNAVARELAKTNPDKYVGTLIYSIARQLPETVDHLEPNVFGYLTETSAAWWEPGVQAADQELSRQWAKRCKHLSRYDYYGFASMTPRFYPHHMAEQLAGDKALGFEGMYTEVYTFLPHTAPMIWAFAQLEWDHRQNIAALLTEFYLRMYGRAAGTMARYYDLMERSYNTPRPGRGRWEHRNVINQALAISPEAVDEGLTLLAQARHEAGDPRVDQRLAIVQAALECSSFPIKSYAVSRQLGALPVTDAASAAKVTDLLAELATLSAKRGPAWAAASERGDLLGETIRGLSGAKYLMLGDAARLEGGGMAAATRLLGWYTEHEPAKVATVAARLASAGPGGDVANAARAWAWVNATHPTSRVKNGGFEERGAARPGGEADWQAAGAPAAWSTWDRDGKAALAAAPGAGRGGGVAATIAHADGAVYLQDVPAKPGERYLVVAWGKGQGGRAGRGGGLTIRFRKPGGGWHEQRELEKGAELVAGDAWQPMVTFITVPEGAGSFVVMLGADGQQPEETVWFDDVAAYALPAEW